LFVRLLTECKCFVTLSGSDSHTEEHIQRKIRSHTPKKSLPNQKQISVP